VIPDDLIALIEMVEHVSMVKSNIYTIESDLTRRAIIHDLSKYDLVEFEDFVELKKISRKHPYGSVEYDESLKDNQAIAHHFANNSHHPEYYPNGIEDMSLGDIIEMVCDWRATWELRTRKKRTAITWEEGMKKQTERFKLQEKHLWLIDLIIKELT